MSQTVTNLTSAKTANALWYGSAGKTESSQDGTVQAFDQKLLSMLLGNANPQEGQASAQLLTLAGLQQTGETVQEEGTEGALDTIIEGLLEQLQKLDDALQDNPSLMAALQGWLQNWQNVMQPNAETAGDVPSAEANALQALAEHPETMRFAVQDALVQLQTFAAGSGSGTAESTQAQSLLDSLQGLLGSLPDSAELTPSSGKSTDLSNLVQFTSVVDKNATVTQQSNSGQNGQSSQNGNSQAGLTTSSQKTAAVQADFSVNTANQTVGDVAAEDGSQTETMHTDAAIQTGTIVTAGQLAMRDGGMTQVKQAAPSVPVEQFSKEMSGFLVSKLEIVKIQGVSEAKISLHPEHLGQVDVKILLQDGQLTAQFVTDNSLAKESLEQQMAQLRSALQSQGLQVSKLEVTQSSELSSQMYHQDRGQSGSGSEERQSSNKRREIQEDILAVKDLNDEWNEWMSREHADEEGHSFMAQA